MTPDRRVHLVGRLLAASVATLAALAVLATRFLEPSAEPVFQWLIYGSAAGLLALALAGTFLLRTWVENHGPQGVIVPMALAEGVAMLGCVASALAGQAAWAVGLGIMAIVVIVRMQTAGLGSGPP